MRRIALSLCIAAALLSIVALATGGYNADIDNLLTLSIAGMVVLNLHRILASFIRNVRRYL